MGDTRPTTRTLPTGEKVTHHPDGRQVLQLTNTLGALLDEQQNWQEEASAALTDALVQSAIDKREAQSAGDVVPSDKRSV